MLDIVTLGDDAIDGILRKKAGPIKDFGPDIKALVEGMHEAMLRGKGIGLAGPQVDRSLRIFVTNVEGDQARAFINPEIVMTSTEEVDYEEGCLSIPGLYTNVRRPASVRIQAWNERGRPFTLDATELLARVILHENDHLEGILFIDRLSASRRERALSTYLKKIRM
ncbi:MAG TPA: peptide deformylase [Rectinemataceae bacterium]|nr:peptide deformylase [Rectinemataceae bacterium]